MIFHLSLDGKLLQEAKKVFTDANAVAYDNTMPPGTYQVEDVKGLCIAYGWYEKEEKAYKFAVNTRPDITSRRMN